MFVSRVALALMGLLAALFVAPAAATASDPDVMSVDVTFTVRNANRTLVVCPADGKTYVLRGQLVGPATSLDGSPIGRVNVLVHDITAGAWFWRMPGHDAYDYAGQLARAGEVSLVFDRLGYDGSPLANGNSTCLGAHADMLHQVIKQLRAGSYAADAGTPAVESVVTHGHSVGAAIAQVEAATWHDVDGLVVMSWSDSGASVRSISEAATQNAACLLGGGVGAPKTYAWFGRTPEAFRSMLFRTALLAVQESASALRNPDPCGDALSLATTVALGNVLTRLIDVPVLLLFGEKDALNRPDSRMLQPLAYGPGARVTAHTLAGTGSALPLEQSAPHTRAYVTSWLCETLSC
jgi:pimeloyl-ACP methyl ester carboxylesterase